MSTYLQVTRAEQAISPEFLKGYFHSFAKPAAKYRVGLEWELFGVSPETGCALPYDGPHGIEAVLSLLAEKFGYQSIKEDGHIVALFRGEDYVALEPGGQLELSAGPVATVHEARQILEKFRDELREIGRCLSCAWMTVGFHPFSRLEEMDWVPKKRYKIMKDYLASTGARSHDMMKRTAANQVSLDFESESDAMEKLRVIYGATSLVSAMFAHSSLSEGKWNGFLTRRMASWRQTDPDRSGLVPAFLNEGSRFDDYLDYVLDAPMIFIIRDTTWIPMNGLRFRDFLSRGYGDFLPTRDDFELHLSTLFPEARIKNCIEIRGADGQTFELIPSVAALWKGLLYHGPAREAAWQLVKGFTWEERRAFHEAIETEGPRAFLGAYRGWDLLKELVALARKGLIAQNRLNREGQDESVYLDLLLEKVIQTERTPAETLKEKWQGEFHEEPRLLIEYLGFQPDAHAEPAR